MPIRNVDKRTATHYRWGPMEKTHEEKLKAAAALLKEGRQEVISGEAKIAIATRDLRTAEKDKPKATQPPFYPQKEKILRFKATQICSKTTPAEAEARIKKLGQ
jgi:hypothetical protein